jgi:hypothetical protein
MSVQVKGNRVTGGTPTERIIAAMEASRELSASGRRRDRYSQSGNWTVGYGITGEPKGYRTDCSQWFTSMYWSAGLPDPNGLNYSGGFTGTLGAHGEPITQGELEPGCAILYGPPPHHHVEMFRGPGVRTIGHGTPPVDYGTVYQVAGERSFRRYIAKVGPVRKVNFTRSERHTLHLLMTERERRSTPERRSLIRQLKRQVVTYRSRIRAAAALSGWDRLDRRARYDGLIEVYNGGSVLL